MTFGDTFTQGATGRGSVTLMNLGASVVQTDRLELALDVCRRNAARNGARTIEHRVADWTDWSDTDRYDVILGSDVVYSEPMQPHVRRILETNLAPGGRVLLADPFRLSSIRFLESLEADGWRVAMSKWTVGEERTPRPIGVFELSPPA